MYALFKEIKEKNLIPCIVFQQNTSYCKEIYSKLVNYLEKLEKLNYPFHYENLEYRQKCFISSEKLLKKFRQSIKPPKDLTNPLQYIEDALESKREDLNTKFMKDFIKVVDKQISMLNNKNEQNSKIIDIQIQNLKKELNEFMASPETKICRCFSKT